MKAQESASTQLHEGVPSQPSSNDIQEWIVEYISNLLEVDPKSIKVSLSFDRYGLDSSATIALTSDLSDWLNHEIDPTITYDYPTIEALSSYLSSLTKVNE
jgi:acyl carrier protein